LSQDFWTAGDRRDQHNWGIMESRLIISGGLLFVTDWLLQGPPPPCGKSPANNSAREELLKIREKYHPGD